MAIFRNGALFARLSKSRSFSYIILAREIMKLIKESDLPTLVLALDHIINFLRRVPKNVSNPEQRAEQK